MSGRTGDATGNPRLPARATPPVPSSQVFSGQPLGCGRHHPDQCSQTLIDQVMKASTRLFHKSIHRPVCSRIEETWGSELRHSVLRSPRALLSYLTAFEPPFTAHLPELVPGDACSSQHRLLVHCHYHDIRAVSGSVPISIKHVVVGPVTMAQWSFRMAFRKGPQFIHAAETSLSIRYQSVIRERLHPSVNVAIIPSLTQRAARSRAAILSSIESGIGDPSPSLLQDIGPSLTSSSGTRIPGTRVYAVPTFTT